MTFLWPAGLLGLLAVPLLVLLYLFRSRYQPQRVPSLILWRRVPRDEATANTLRRPRWEWLLLWQVLLASLLALMLARPVLDLPGARHVGLVMDLSANMAAREGGVSRLDVARQQAASLAHESGPRDRFTVVASGRQPRVMLLGGSIADVDSALAALQPDDSASELSSGIALAAAQTDARAGGVTEVVVFADRAVPMPAGLPVTMRVIGHEQERLAIPYASVRRTPDGGGRLAGFASVVNPGEQARRGTLTVTSGTTILSRISLDLPANGRQDVTFVGPSNASALTVALADEEPWPGGNRLQLDAPARFARSILIVSDEPTLWEHALSVVPDLVTRTVASADYQLSADDALVLFDRFLPTELPSLPMILVDPPDRPGLIERPAGPPRARAAVDLDADDPLVHGIDLAPLSVTARQASVPRWAAVPARAVDGPLLLYGVWQARPIVALTFDPGESNLPQLEAFPLLLTNVIDWLVPGRADVLQTGLGSSALTAPSAASVAVASPGGSVPPPSIELWPILGGLAALVWLGEWLVAWGGVSRWLQRRRRY